MIITAIVFSLMMKVELQSFAIFLFTGLIPWTLFSSCVNLGSVSIIENESLLKKIYVPRQTFVVSRCLSLLVDSILSFIALFILAVFIGAHLNWSLFFLPISFFLVFVFTIGVVLVSSVLSVFYRDVQNIIGIALQVGYYLTPIIYPTSIVPEKYSWLYTYNPLYYFVELFRQPIYSGMLPSLVTVAVCLVCAFLSLIIGILIFRKYDHLLIFRL